LNGGPRYGVANCFSQTFAVHLSGYLPSVVPHFEFIETE
jgi:hypothetical protein